MPKGNKSKVDPPRWVERTQILSFFQRGRRRPSTDSESSDSSENSDFSLELCCAYCGEPGHDTRKCWHNGPIECHDCGELGHKRKFCPN